MKRLTFLALLLLISSFFFTSPLEAAFDSADFNKSRSDKILKVLRITPSGADVPAQRQIVITFDRPTVPIGRMERTPSEVPVTISPKLNCEWRWLDTSNLSCNLGEKDAIVPSTRYKVRVKAGFKADDGSLLKDTITHFFTTIRPKITNKYFKTWSSPGTPHILITFNQPVKESTLAKNIIIVTTDDKLNKTGTYKLRIEEDPNSKRYSYYTPGTRWILKPAKKLPPDTRYEVIVKPGIASTLGPELSIEGGAIVTSHTFPKFRFLGISCIDSTDTNSYNTLYLYVDKKIENAGKKCDPLMQINLLFTAPFPKEDIKTGLKVNPDLSGGRSDYDPWAASYASTYLGRSVDKGDVNSIRLPSIKAFEKYTLKAKASKIKDVFGRALAEDIEFEFFTDHRRPNYHFANPFFVLEKGVDSVIPITVTNLKNIELNFDLLSAGGITKDLTHSSLVEEVEDVSFRMPLGIKEALNGASGVLIGTLDTTPTLRRNENDKFFIAQVTPYNVQAKVGHFNTLVWVTDFKTGAPVKDAKVSIFLSNLKDINPRDTKSVVVTNSLGIAILPGTKKLDPELKYLSNYGWWNHNSNSSQLMVKVEKSDDIALLPLLGSFHVDARGMNNSYLGSNNERLHGHIKTWGTTAQGIYKAGDTIQFKLFVRSQDNKGLIQPPLSSYTLIVKDPMGKKIHEEKNITLTEFGTYAGEVPIPKTGAVGWYNFNLTADYMEKDHSWTPLRVLVSDFTPAPFKVSSELNGTLFRDGDSVEVSTMGRLHSGGPYTDARLRITARVTQRSLKVRDPLARGFTFDTYTPYFYGKNVFDTNTKLDNKGDSSKTFKLNKVDVLYGSLFVESAVMDDRGKFVATSKSATYVGRDRYVGLKKKSWVMKKDKAQEILILTVDENGMIASDIKVKLTIQYRETKAAKVKGAGNTYITRYKHKWVKVASCDVVSTSEPVACGFTPDRAGSYKFTAKIKDTLGRSHKTELHSWATGGDWVIWDELTGNHLNIFPESEDIKIGDTARYMVQNPYPKATALITIERYGILRSWVENFDSSSEIIEFPVTEDLSPGYYLSVTVFSPRAATVTEMNTVDLGKPAFKTGYVRVDVKDKYKEIGVKIKTDKEEYRPRETVKVKVSTSLKSAVPLMTTPPMELAVAVLDESVLDLIKGGSTYFDPYKGFYSLGGLDVFNFNLLRELIGRQLLKKKGADVGGDAGADLDIRSLFKFVSYWNPSIMTDNFGAAEFSFELPDNLTGWRILVMAANEADRFGLGQNTIKTNLPTEIRPALPNQVSEKDDFLAGFVVMNRTDKQRTLKVTIEASGDVLESEASPTSKTEFLSTEPYKRYIVRLPVIAAKSGEISFKISAGDSLDTDATVASVKVLKTSSLETSATYGTTTMNEVTEKILIPEQIRTDVGKLSVIVSPSAIGGLENAFKYMRDYPYICWEQILSKGVMAAHYNKLTPYIDTEMVPWEDSAKITKDMLLSAAAHQAPNGGMAYYIPNDEYVSPYLSAYTALAFNWLKRDGYDIPSEVEAKLHDYLIIMLRKNVFPTFYSKGMSSTVRAVALAALAPNGKLTKDDVLRYASHVGEMTLFGKAHFLLALMDVPGTLKLQKTTVKNIMSHINLSSGKAIFSEAIYSGFSTGDYSRILSSELKSNGAVLSALLRYSEGSVENAQSIADIPFKIVHYMTQSRKQKDRWENTQENIFALNALVDYSTVYEKELPNFNISAMIDNEVSGSANFNSYKNEPKEFFRALEKDDPGSSTHIKLLKNGQGRAYYSARLTYSPLLPKNRNINSGIEIKREYSVERNGKWVLLGNKMKIKTGDIIKVDIFLSIPAARNFVVINDPVPGGLEPVNRDLATASTVDADKATSKYPG
ncbi:MAG: large extracellular alpha-helical protein, partial [Deltaproteobacteria bacterium]|nr:large extracellular alpha-helical protein [Deltaproteobacteria bacterium]